MDPSAVSDAAGDVAVAAAAAASAMSGEGAAVRQPPQPLALRVMRSGQLDADMFDGELQAILAERFATIGSLFSPSFKTRFDPEISALSSYLARESLIISSGSTYGLRMQNLKYRDESQHTGVYEFSSYMAPVPMYKRALHAFIQIGGSWAHTRITRHMTLNAWAEADPSSLKFKAYKWMNRIEQLFKAATLVNFLLFLSNGRYRSLIDRLLGMRVVYAHPTMSRSISFDFMNRQLVWQAFTEFVVFLLSYININGLKRSLVKIFKLKLKVDENLATLPPHLCAICFSNNKSGESTLHIPFASDACGHVFCYYCLKTEMMSDELFACPRCGVRVAGIHRIV